MDLVDRKSQESSSDLLDGGGAPGRAVDGAVVASLQAAAAGAQVRRIRGYEELDGAEGRGVFFRPHRFTAEDLAPLRASVALSVGAEVHDCALRDVSQNGVAFVWPRQLAVRNGQALTLSLRFDGHRAWRGDGRVSSVREADGDLVVGASLDGALLDTDALLQLRQVRAWAPDAPLRLETRPWHAPGYHRFKALVSEFRLYLEDAEERLGELERELPWHVLQDPASPARGALVSRLRSEMGSEIVRYAAEIDEARREAGPEADASLKEFSVRQVHRFLMTTPWMHRARHKPFGYPGDYEVMNFVYERNFEGATLFARAVGLGFLQAPASCAVRYRKDLMKRQLRAVLDRHAGASRPVRFLSIAAGPARELQELLAELEELPVPLEIVLFDQDKGALAHAYGRLRPLAESRFPGRARVVYLNESIKRLLRDAHLFEPFGGFDAVYSVGLFDYLQETTAMRLARNLCAAAAPGAPVLIANMVDHASRWFMEHHLEWDLLYRSREELAAIGRRAMPKARVRILEEEAGVNPFIELVHD